MAKRSRPAPASAMACRSSAWRSRGTTCVETSSRRSPRRASTRSSKSGEVAAYVPTAPLMAPTATWSTARSSRRRLRSASKAKPASFMPKVVGSAWMPCVRPVQTVWTWARACSASASRTSRAPATSCSPALRSWSASAVSSTSEEVRPKWIQRPAGPALSLRTSTKAATSWSVIRSRSCTASTVKVAARMASRSSGVGPSISSQAATSTCRQASILASSVQRAPISGRV